MKGRVYSGQVLGVVDGDTLDVSVDVGFHVYVVVRVRLRLVYAPEVESSAGMMCSEKLGGICTPGTVLTLRIFKTEKYGRWVADVWVGDVFVNEEMRKFIPGCGS